MKKAESADPAQQPAADGDGYATEGATEITATRNVAQQKDDESVLARTGFSSMTAMALGVAIVIIGVLLFVTMRRPRRRYYG